MFLHVGLALLLIFLAQAEAATGCGGRQGIYVCNPSDPTKFNLCIGSQEHVMSCPAGLHFNSRTQVCDWPKNADCGKSRTSPSSNSPATPFRLAQPQTHTPPIHTVVLDYRAGGHPPADRRPAKRGTPKHVHPIDLIASSPSFASDSKQSQSGIFFTSGVQRNNMISPSHAIGNSSNNNVRQRGSRKRTYPKLHRTIPTSGRRHLSKNINDNENFKDIKESKGQTQQDLLKQKKTKNTASLKNRRLHNGNTHNTSSVKKGKTLSSERKWNLNNRRQKTGRGTENVKTKVMKLFDWNRKKNAFQPINNAEKIIEENRNKNRSRNVGDVKRTKTANFIAVGDNDNRTSYMRVGNGENRNSFIGIRNKRIWAGGFNNNRRWNKRGNVNQDGYDDSVSRSNIGQIKNRRLIASSATNKNMYDTNHHHHRNREDRGSFIIKSADSTSDKSTTNSIIKTVKKLKEKNTTSMSNNIEEKNRNMYDRKVSRAKTRGVSEPMTGHQYPLSGLRRGHYPWWGPKFAHPTSLSRLFPLPAPRVPRYKPRHSPSSPSARRPTDQRTLAQTSFNPANPHFSIADARPIQQQHKRLLAAERMTSVAATTNNIPQRKPKQRKTGTCSSETCRLPDCRCVGTDIPGGLPREDTPQMIMLTFDDSVNVANYDYYKLLFGGNFLNPNGCPIKGTFYVSGEATQYHFVEKLHRQGLEIASHSLTHRSPISYWNTAGYEGYVSEIDGLRRKLTQKSGIPREDIKGMRVPFLQGGGDDQFQMLEDFGYTFDSSMVTGHLFRNNNPPIWPFTLDYPPDSKTCSLPTCPKHSYPGLWEVPLVRWYGSNRLACAMPDGCTVEPGKKGTLEFLEDNFYRHYNTNKSPMGIFLHASWFRRKEGNLEGLMEFLQKVLQKKDVWVVTVSQTLDWIQNPVPNNMAGFQHTWACD